MKLNYKANLIASAILLGISIGHVTAGQTKSHFDTAINHNSDSWVAIENINGITVICTPFELNGVSYLKVRFENKTNHEINFTWSLNDGVETVVNETKYSVKANDFIETDNNTLILYNNGASQALFSFNLKIN